jgi:predicted component of type VI protein secretion system
MKFRLIYQGNDVRLGLGDHLIGRSPDCAITLLDPQVSRHHALVQVGDEEVHIQDLQSRNGTAVNGIKLADRARVEAGDCIGVGEFDLLLVTGTSPRANATTAREQTASPGEMLAMLGKLADKALALGNTSEAERILRHHLEALLARVIQGYRPDPRVFETALKYASKLAIETRQGRWFSYVFELCNGAGEQAPSEALEDLYAAAQRIESPQLQSLSDYITLHRGRQASLSPRERFILGRAEGLLRSLRP